MKQYWFLIGIFGLVPVLYGSSLWVPEGKKRTGREIALETRVNAPVERIFEFWTTAEGAKKFFGLEAVIDPRTGGEYSIYFDLEDRRQSSEGSKILRLDSPYFLAFEWKGKPEMVEMNTPPLPTWVEIRLEALPGTDTQTRVILHHYGFGFGGTWDESYAFFTQAWSGVLKSLQSRMAKGSK